MPLRYFVNPVVGSDHVKLPRSCFVTSAMTQGPVLYIAAEGGFTGIRSGAIDEMLLMDQEFLIRHAARNLDRQLAE